MNSAGQVGLVLCTAFLAATCARDSGIAAKPDKRKPTTKTVPLTSPQQVLVKEHMMNQSKVTLEWDMRLDGAKRNLQIAYSITNKSDKVVYVSDKLLITAGNNGFVPTDSVTVMNDDEPGVLKFALLPISSNRPAAQLYGATYLPIQPSATYKTVRQMPYPLKSWNPVGGTNPIADGAKFGVLLLGYFYGDPPQWKDIKKGDVVTAKVPVGHQLQLLRSAKKPLPQ